MVDKTQFTSFGASGLVELITHKGFRILLSLDDLGAIAQLVEQQVEALCVGGSIPPCAIKYFGDIKTKGVSRCVSQVRTI